MNDVSKFTDIELKEKFNEIVKKKLYNLLVKAVDSTKTKDNNMKGRLEQLKLSLVEPLKMLKVYEEKEKITDVNYQNACSHFEEIKILIAEYEKRFNKKTNIEISQHKDNVNCYHKRY